MKSTLVTFIAEIANLFGKDFDHAYKKQIESSIIGFRATLLKQEYDKNGRFPVGSVESICLPLTRVPAVECCVGEDSGCVVTRTKDRVPSPIRTNRNPEPFLFVGTSNQEKGFTFTNPENVSNIREGTRYMKNTILYSYYNDYIYIYAFEGDRVTMRSAFANPFELLELKDCHGKPCLDDIYIEEDMKKTIRQMIIEDFRGIGLLPNEKEINLNEAQP